MEEASQCKKRARPPTRSLSSSRPARRRASPSDEEEAEASCVECSGQGCRACSASLVADCVALCCCPLAVVSFIGLALIKVPCAVGRRCFERRKKRRNPVNDKCRGGLSEEGSADGLVLGVGEEDGMVQQRRSMCAGFIEADSVLLEFYQVGHLGFGRDPAHWQGK